MGDIATYANLRIPSTALDVNSYVGVDNLLPNQRGKVKSNYVPTSGAAIGYKVADILIGNIRPYLKKIWFASSSGGASQDVLVVRVREEGKDSISPRFLYHLLATEKFFTYDMQYAKGAKMPRGDKAAIMQYVVSIPSFKEQVRIVAILDKFDTLTHSITEGLPREIALRQKQYGHYRDLLFRFSKPAQTAAWEEPDTCPHRPAAGSHP